MSIEVLITKDEMEKFPPGTRVVVRGNKFRRPGTVKNIGLEGLTRSVVWDPYHFRSGEVMKESWESVHFVRELEASDKYNLK